MNSAFLKLNAGDFARGAALAIIVAVLGGIQQMFAGHGFDFASWNWGMIGDLALTAFSGYLSKNLLSNENGKMFGKIG